MDIRHKIGRFARERHGATTAEFALISVVMIALIFGIVELALILLTQNALENAARVASRYGITGQVPVGQTRDEAILSIARDQLPGIVDRTELSLTTLTYGSFDSIGQPEPFTDANGNGQYNAGESFTDVNGNSQWDADQGIVGAGGTGEIVLYDLRYSWVPLFGFVQTFGVSALNLSARIIVRNEP
jgi:Flp pilus assembly protein TadG